LRILYPWHARVTGWVSAVIAFHTPWHYRMKLSCEWVGNGMDCCLDYYLLYNNHSNSRNNFIAMVTLISFQIWQDHSCRSNLASRPIYRFLIEDILFPWPCWITRG
jgi:hypothetical protein